MVEAHVGHSLDFGKNETYLVHLLNPSDYVLGFDLYGANTIYMDLYKYKGLDLWDVVLMKKIYEEKR